MLRTNPQRFAFSGSALAVGASLTHPVRESLVDQTSVVLAPTGGYATQTRRETNFRDLIRTGLVTATVIGEETETDWLTLSTVTIENLDILGVVRADAIVSRIAARYPKAALQVARNDRMHPTSFFFSGSAFHGLKIDGAAIQPQLVHPSIPGERDPGSDLRFVANADESLVSFYREGPDNTPLFSFSPTTKAYRFRKDAVQTAQIFGVPTDTPGRFKIDLNYPIEQFGTVSLGNLITVTGKVTLSMVRTEFGCTACGSTSCGVVHGNGQPIPGGG